MRVPGLLSGGLRFHPPRLSLCQMCSSSRYLVRESGPHATPVYQITRFSAHLVHKTVGRNAYGRNFSPNGHHRCPSGHPGQQKAARMAPRMSSLRPCCLVPQTGRQWPWRISALLSAVSPKEPPEKGRSAHALSFDLPVFTCHGYLCPVRQVERGSRRATAPGWQAKSGRWKAAAGGRRDFVPSDGDVPKNNRAPSKSAFFDGDVPFFCRPPSLFRMLRQGARDAPPFPGLLCNRSP